MHGMLLLLLLLLSRLLPALAVALAAGWMCAVAIASPCSR